MQKLFYLLLVLLVLPFVADAQDIITRKNGQILKVKIIEVGSTEVRYKNFGDDAGPIYALENDRISSIKYESGKEERLEKEPRDMEQYAGQKKHALKINFLSPLFGHTMLTYERSPKLGQSFEASLSIIGFGKKRDLDYWGTEFKGKTREQSGIGLGVGYKFIKLPNFQFGKMRFTHIMQGSYVKPAFYGGSFKENVVVYKGGIIGEPVMQRQTVNFGAFQLELGRQWVLGDNFVLDTYTGIGLGFDNRNSNEFFEDGRSISSYNYLNQRGGSSPGVSLNGGIKLGFLF